MMDRLPMGIQPWPLPLEEWLEYNVDDLLAQIPNVPAGKDYPLSFRWVTGDGRRTKIDPYGDNRDFEVAVFRWAMKETGAIQYCIIGAMWFVVIGKDKSRSEIDKYIKSGGTSHPNLKPHRVEGYVVICGDKDRTISATFDVRRDYKGKIRELIRRKEEPGVSEGRFINLLVERAESEALH